MGLISGLAIILLAGLAADARERRSVRIGAAALLPPLVVALLLTFARGPIALTALGLVLVLLMARPGALAGMLVSCALPVLIAVLVTLQADVLTSASFRSDEGVSEGLHVLLVTLGCSAWAGLFRAIAALHLNHRRPPRTLVRGAAIVAAVLAASALVAAFGSGFAERQWDRFARAGGVEYADPRARLLDPGNNGRIELWELALDVFAREPLRGTAGPTRCAGTRSAPCPTRRANSGGSGAADDSDTLGGNASGSGEPAQGAATLADAVTSDAAPNAEQQVLDSGSLPFTGYAGVTAILLGLGLLAAGIVPRRGSRALA